MKISKTIETKSGVIAHYREIKFRFNAAKITNLLKEKIKNYDKFNERIYRYGKAIKKFNSKGAL